MWYFRHQQSVWRWSPESEWYLRYWLWGRRPHRGHGWICMQLSCRPWWLSWHDAEQCRTSLAYPLFLIWRKSVNEGSMPNSCKLGNIIPIHKGKSRAIAKNYRPVALTSLLVKTFEKVVRKQLVQYFDEHEMFNDSQHGFRSSWSCLSQLLAHFDHITQLLEEGKSVDVVHLDFAKAFDKVDIGITLRKLKSLGIHGNLGKWLLSFLSGHLQCVLVNGKKSQPKPVLSGVPQGSVLGPLLFLILSGDIDKDIVTSFLSSFADDTRVGHAIASKQDMTQLQTDLETVYCWAVRNNMEFNSDKFESIRYSPTKSPLDTGNTQYYSNIGTPIQQQRHIRDLGVTISEDATFSQYISEKIATIKSKTGWVLRTFKLEIGNRCQHCGNPSSSVNMITAASCGIFIAQEKFNPWRSYSTSSSRKSVVYPICHTGINSLNWRCTPLNIDGDVI